MKQRFYNLKIFKLLTSENKKKRALSVFVLLLLVSVICEIFVFNFKFWGSVTSEELSLAPSQINGGLKLDGALSAFGIDVTGRLALDVGASSGGFTDCLLKRGALSVISVDSGSGQLAESLRCDSRVTG